MKYSSSDIKEIAIRLVEDNLTIREVACIFKKSKSTIHKCFKERLSYIDNNLFLKVEEILKEHKETRHLRGGEATKLKYKKKDNY